MFNIFKKEKIESKKRPYPDVPYRIIKSWDTEKAKTCYVLYVTGIIGGGYFGYDWCWREEARGGKEWAHRTAKHYGIEIEKSESKFIRTGAG